MGTSTSFCDNDSGFRAWNDVSNIDSGSNDSRLGGRGLLGHSGRDGRFTVGHGANGDVCCDRVRVGDSCGDGRDRGCEGSGRYLGPLHNNRGRCGCPDYGPGFTTDQHTTGRL